jgi:AmmeMemoRadiSam system protein B
LLSLRRKGEKVMTGENRKWCSCVSLGCWALPAFVVIVFLYSAVVHAGERVRRPAVAGYFYPLDQKGLRKTVDDFISNVKQDQIPGKILGLMCPHAGYVFSGQVAAYSYRQVMGRDYDTVVIIGPSHRVYLEGASVGTWDAYETPLGRVSVNKEIVSALLEMGEPFRFIERAHSSEHSVETQIPFLQRVLKGFDIVPIVMGIPSLRDCETVGKALARTVAQRNVLFVASSDMSHYPNYADAKKVDGKTLSIIEQFDPELVFSTAGEFLRKGIPNLSTTLCGLSSVVSVMMAVERCEASAVKVLHYANSGDVTIHGHRDKRRVVGYGAVAFYKK